MNAAVLPAARGVEEKGRVKRVGGRGRGESWGGFKGEGRGESWGGFRGRGRELGGRGEFGEGESLGGRIWVKREGEGQ